MTTRERAALVDTNVLVYSLFPDSPHYTHSRRMIDAAGRANTPELYVTSQILGEFHAVVTNPKQVETPRSSDEAIEAIEYLLFSGLQVLPVPADHTRRWTALVKEHPVTGGGVFDVQHVATMLANRVTTVFTYNTSDFERFTELTVLAPPSAVPC